MNFQKTFQKNSKKSVDNFIC